MAPSKLDWCQPGPVALPGHHPAAAVAAPAEGVAVGPGVGRRQPKAGAKAKAVAASARAPGRAPAAAAAVPAAGKGSSKGRGRPKRCCVETAAEILEEYMVCTPTGDYFGSNPNPRRQLVAALKKLRDCMELPETDKEHVLLTAEVLTLKKQLEIAKTASFAWSLSGRFNESMCAEYRTARAFLYVCTPRVFFSLGLETIRSSGSTPRIRMPFRVAPRIHSTFGQNTRTSLQRVCTRCCKAFANLAPSCSMPLPRWLARAWLEYEAEVLWVRTCGEKLVILYKRPPVRGGHSRNFGG
jgi:hypothetical protein